MSELPIISISILIPLLSAIYIMVFVSHSKSHKKELYATYVSILASSLTFLSTLYLILSFDPLKPGLQFIENYNWVPSIGLEIFFGVDGLSVYFIFLTSLLSLICIIASLFTVQFKIKEFLVCFLLLESFCIGAFSSFNLLLFYIFFEVILIPMYLIIGVWGGNNKIYAAFKFFLYTFFGSVFFLIALIYIYTKTGTFNIIDLIEIIPQMPLQIQIYLWLATFISFAIKVPMAPFHTWLPDAHVQAPTSGSVILAGILLKLGGYAFLRISLPMLPLASEYFALYMIWLSGFAIIYASFVAMNQTDMKKMIAYSSVAHMGYVTGGIFSFTTKGIGGAIFQMISHGLISSALFLIVGMLYQRNKTKKISEYGGVATQMPILASFFMIVMLGSVGLPGLSGFVGEFLTILGIFEINTLVGVISSFGVVLGAIYMLRLYKDTMFGKTNNTQILYFKDLTFHEILCLLPLVILIIYIGVVPNTILNKINIFINNISAIYLNL